MKFSTMKKLFCGMIAAVGITCGAYGAQIVRVVDTYDQLQSMSGQDGVFFVREAGRGQHADPRVKSGWAVYIYDARGGGFRMITKQEAMTKGESANEYLTKALYLADIVPYKQTVNDYKGKADANAQSITELKAVDAELISSLATLAEKAQATSDDVGTTTNRVAALEAQVATDGANIAGLTTRADGLDESVAGLQTTATGLRDDLTAADQKIDTTANSVRGYTDEKIADLKIDIITNTAVRMQRTLTTANAYTDQVKTETLAAAAADAADKDAAVLSSAESAAATAKTEAIAEAKSYTDTATGDLLSIGAAQETYQPKGNYLVPADIEGKADKSFLFKDNLFYNELVYGAIKSIFWNETTGGGIRIENSDTGVKSAFSVNDGGGGGIYGQIYAVKKIDGKSTGTRITITDHGAFYTVTNTYQWTEKDEIVAKRDLDAYQPAGEYLVAADIAGKLDASVAEATYQPKGDYLTEHQDISGKLDATVAAETYQPKGTYIVEGSPLTLPLKLKKGDSLYQLDVVDNGGDDISLSITKIPTND